MRDPFHSEDQIAVMLMETFQDYGTQLQAYRQMCQKQDARIKELLGANSVLARDVSELQERHEALRDVRRREKRAELEGELILPGDSRGFSTKRKG